MVENIPDMDAILAQMKENFLETAQEKLERMDEILELFISGNGKDPDLQEEFSREVHSLKGLGGTFQMPLVTSVCHALEAYVEDEPNFTPELSKNSHIYVDRIVELIASGEADDESKLPNWLDGLPVKHEVSPEPRDATIPLVMIAIENKVQMNVAAASFTDNGFSVVTTQSPFEAYEMAMRQKPRIIVTSQNFRSMNGAELLRSLSATQELSKAKYAMVCPDRRKALEEDLQGVQLLSEKNLEQDTFNFIAIAITV